jgi:RHS repeat-associated protein
VTDPLGAITEYRYNSQGQRTDIIDAVGNHWLFDYDSFGLPTTQTDPLGNTTTFQYNLSGELEWIVDRQGRRIDFTYDDAHRVQTETWDTAPPSVTSYTYNAAGQVTGAAAPDSVLSVDYWPTGLVRSVDNAGTPGAPNVVITYGYYDQDEQLQPGYDANGNVTHVMDSLDALTEYAYDALGRLVSVAQYRITPPTRSVAGAEPRAVAALSIDRIETRFREASRRVQSGPLNEKRVELTYDDASLLQQLSRFADLAGSQAVATTGFDYDCGGCAEWLNGIHHRKASDNSVILDLDLVRDDAGSIIGSADSEGGHAYAYDGLTRLLTAVHPGGGVQPDEFYTYDSVGNRLSSHTSTNHVYSYALGQGGNQLRQDDDFDYQYDGNGNLVLKTDRSTNEAFEYVYDHRGRLTDITKLNAMGQPIEIFSYRYDAANRRIQADHDGSVTHFVYDGRNPIAALDSVGAEESRRMYSRLIDDVLADEVNGQTRWFLKDQVGTVRGLIGNAGSLLNQYVYDSFGSLLSQTDPGVQNDLLWNAREFDAATSMGYFRARYYDPAVGRFAAEDPLAPYGYAFAANRPISAVDPDGRTAVIQYACLILDVYGKLGPILKAKESAAYKFWWALAQAVVNPDQQTEESIKKVQKLFYEYLLEILLKPAKPDPVGMACGAANTLL